MKNFIFEIEKAFYERIFQEKLSPEIQLFIRDLGYVTFGYGISAFFVFAFQIIAGRVLGPEEYGKYALVDSVAMFLQIVMLLGISTAAIKYNVVEKDFKRQREVVSTSYWMVLILAFVSSLFFFVFSLQFSRIFSVPLLIFRLSIIFTFFLVLYILSTDALRGLYQIKKLALFRSGYGLVALVTFLLLISSKHFSFITAISSICFSYLITFLLITLKIRKYISFQFNRSLANKFFKYGRWAVIGGISFVFFPALSKIMVNKYLTTVDVGVYNAYYFSSVAITLFFSKIFITVFFPAVSKYQQKSPIFKKIRDFLPYSFLIGIPIFFITETIILKFYGKEYFLNYWLILLFALASIFITIHGIYNWLFCSEGILGVKLAAGSSMIIVVVNILLSSFLIPLFALYGAIIALGMAYLGGIIYFLSLRKKIP